MRTTVRLDDPLLAEAKKYAADSGKTLTAVIEDSLRETLARRKHPVKRRKVRLPTFPGGRLRPGVDLDDTSAILDLMESRNVAD
ncbi:MAG TPA: type II toxin-antitoxin system VapB family antitoxin [Bryobacteraceae bacterium]|nr:type II toxin-antitoxin system VapB family antitoxin [Bryobacteraceae bacterium]